ncbi:MAG TPA: PepSY-associated TM helix domain-containing protein [Sphingobium sp.]|nr:PepSY-associated TM helix domain-containing protein [Sphingobium sp.]
MIHLPREETKLMVAVHGWSGIILGLLLYAVVLTGMVAVFAEEIGVWSAGHVAQGAAFERPIDAPLQKLARRTPAEFHEAVDVYEVGDRNLGLFFHLHETAPNGEVIERGINYQLDRSGRVVGEQRGTGEQVFGPSNDDALSHFLIDTHVQLHVPDPWGLLLTGILGLAMLVAAISGLLIHRHLFKDIFTLRRSASAVLVDRDRHSVAGTWSLPFAFILAFTGSFFSFYGTVGVPIVAMAAFGGSQEAFNETVYGSGEKPDPSPRITGSLDHIVADARGRIGQLPTFITIEQFGRADARVTTFHDPKAGGIEPVSLIYRGATGAYVRESPSIGTRPSVGGTLTAIMGPLHFGNFAGLASKSVWFGLGFAMCYVTFTGLRLWLVRRRDGGSALGWLERIVTVIGFGLPLALLGAAIGFFFTMPLGTAVFWTPASFLIVSAAAILAGFTIPTNGLLMRAHQIAIGALLVAMPPIRLLTGGPGWGAALAAGQPMIVAIDLMTFLAGVWTLWRLIAASRADNSNVSARLKPAE